MKNTHKTFTDIYYPHWIKVRDFLMRSSPRWLILLIDLILVSIAFFFTYLLRFNFAFADSFHKFLLQLPLVLLISTLVFLRIKPYRGVVRLTGEYDIKMITKANILIAAVMFLLTILMRLAGRTESFLNFPYSVIIIQFLLATFFMIVARAVYKSLYYKIAREGSKTYKVLIYGTEMPAVRTFETLKNSTDGHYIIEGFIQPEQAGEPGAKRIQGIPIYAQADIDEEWLRRHPVDQVIIAHQEQDPLATLNNMDLFIRQGIQVKVVPPPEQWTGHFFDVHHLQSLNLEMLLDRKPIRLEDRDIRSLLEGKTVMVTGAAGSIGSVLTRQILYYGPAKVILVDQAESPLYDLKVDLETEGYQNFRTVLADIEDTALMEKLMAEHRPDYIFHAAAYKHVPVLEMEPYYGIKVNILATRRLMEAAGQYGVRKFIQISTDKAVNPTNVMGATKRVAELMARCMQEKYPQTEYIVTRFGNVLGSNGSVVHRFRKQIKNGGPVTVTDENIVRYFMTIPEAAHLVLKAAHTGSGGKIYVFDMGHPVRIMDLAKRMIALMGKNPEEIEIRITGLRPGEKIYEELLTSDEKVTRTEYDKLYIARLSPLDCKQLFEQLNLLEQTDLHDTGAVIDLLRRIVPEYKPNRNHRSLDEKRQS